jgi:hypothetical protein
VQVIQVDPSHALLSGLCWLLRELLLAEWILTIRVSFKTKGRMKAHRSDAAASTHSLACDTLATNKY